MNRPITSTFSRAALAVISLIWPFLLMGQINTDQVMRIGRNALYFEDYVLSIQYFNQVIDVRPYLARPYLYRAIAKLNLDDYAGANEDATLAIQRNEFIIDAYEVRGVARQNLGMHSEAVADYDKALEMLPDNKGILFNKAIAQSEMKDWDAARASFDRLVEKYPKFDNAYLGRAQLLTATCDTVAALADIARAIDINPNAVNGYVMRADLAIKRSSDFESALNDMNEAIRLQPRNVGYFINRAFLRYSTDDYNGAMSDYDYAIELDPINTAALFNRGVLRAEVRDLNRAADDFTRVLKINPHDYKALYNRAMLNQQIGNYREALADLDKVIEAFPDFAGAYFLRFDIKRVTGDRRGAERDYNKSIALAKTRVQKAPLDGNPANRKTRDTAGSNGDDETESQEDIAQRFTSLTVMNDNASVQRTFNSKDIRGRVQDNDIQVETEPLYVLSFYDNPTELKPGADYMREVDDINATRILRFPLKVTNREPQLSDADEIKRHFESIEYYNGYISTHTPRTIDYFGRAMDYMTLRNYASAIEDLDRCLKLTPDFALGYFARATARYRQALRTVDDSDTPSSDKNRDGETALKAAEIKNAAIDAINDLDQAIKLSPSMAIAWFNKGCIMLEQGDLTGALSSFSRAIELKPDFGEAFYNRGYAYFRLGNRTSGAADLSKAGELGIMPSYNLLKRMSR